MTGSSNGKELKDGYVVESIEIQRAWVERNKGVGADSSGRKEGAWKERG